MPTVLAMIVVIVGSFVVIADNAVLASSARWFARSLALGDDENEVFSRLQDSVPSGVAAPTVTLRESGTEVCVTLTRRPSEIIARLGVSSSGSSCVSKVL